MNLENISFILVCLLFLRVHGLNYLHHFSYDSFFVKKKS
jgi:hypothetical protein